MQFDVRFPFRRGDIHLVPFLGVGMAEHANITTNLVGPGGSAYVVEEAPARSPRWQMGADIVFSKSLSKKSRLFFALGFNFIPSNDRDREAIVNSIPSGLGYPTPDLVSYFTPKLGYKIDF